MMLIPTRRPIDALLLLGTRSHKSMSVCFGLSSSGGALFLKILSGQVKPTTGGQLYSRLTLCQANMEPEKRSLTDHCPFLRAVVRFHVSLGECKGKGAALPLRSLCHVQDSIEAVVKAPCSFVVYIYIYI